MKSTLRSIFWRFINMLIGAGGLISGAILWMSFIDACLCHECFDMNCFEWVLTIWMLIVPIIFGLMWLFVIGCRFYNWIKSKKDEVAA